jgi:uncharacterized membrane protein YqjE
MNRLQKYKKNKKIFYYLSLFVIIFGLISLIRNLFIIILMPEYVSITIISSLFYIFMIILGTYYFIQSRSNKKSHTEQYLEAMSQYESK